MKYRIKESKNNIQIPALGDFWRYKGCDIVYLRIDRVYICEKLQSRLGENVFYSVNLSTNSITWSGNIATNFEILEPVNVIEFQPAL